MRSPFLAMLLLVTACQDSSSPKPPPPESGPDALTLTHDFGMLTHGERRTHEFDVDFDKLGGVYVPLRVHLECSCGHADIRLRKADGSERFIDGTGWTRNRPNKDERAILHVELDTTRKEAVDLPMTQSKGYIVLQPEDDTTGMGRIQWPFLLRFGIDAPVTLHPYAELALGAIAQSQVGKTLTTLKGDQAHPDMTFPNVRDNHPDLDVALEEADGHTVLHARVAAGELGNHRALIQVDTNLDGYVVSIQATWKVVPDLEATPIAKVSFSAPLDREQPISAQIRQFCLVTDHNLTRHPEFVVRRIVDGDERDMSSHFAVTFQALEGKPRQQRMLVRYLGGLHDRFRGTIELGKRDHDDAVLPIDLVVFPGKRP